MRLLVTGGAGFIGSHAVRQALRAGHEVVVLDDLSRGHSRAVEAAGADLPRQARLVRGRIADGELVAALLRDERIEAVMHFAAFMEVGESVREPGRYYENNAAGSLALLEAMRRAGVRRLVFSSTAAVYGTPAVTPIPEEQPLAPINPYGRSKMVVELMLEDFAAAHGLGFAALRYFNVAGASPEGVIGEEHEPESHLIPRVLAAAAGRAEAIGIFGADYPTPDGTCIRDYVHVQDLADAHLLALERLEPGRGRAFNVGSERGFSVREVIDACARVTGERVPTVEQPRRPGDPPVLVAATSRIRRELGWAPRYGDLETIVRHAWRWHSRSWRAAA